MTVTLTIRQGAELYAEVLTDEGRFFVPFDASVFDLVQQVITGGHWVEDLTAVLKHTHRQGVGHLGGQNGGAG